MWRVVLLFVSVVQLTSGLVPFIDGGKDMPKLYEGWFNDQIAKQASTAVSRAISAGKKKIEVNFPSVPNVDEVRMAAHVKQQERICSPLPQ